MVGMAATLWSSGSFSCNGRCIIADRTIRACLSREMAAPVWLALGWQYWILVRLGISRCKPTDGRYTIVFNGEIYNYGALRAQITNNKEPITSNSDTEVVLALFRQLGPKCLELLEGMFAFAIWDEQEKSCFLARDPLGIKPLYYYAENGRCASPRKFEH